MAWPFAPVKERPENMTEEGAIIEATSDLQLPWDLARWAEVPQICSWVEDVVGGLDWNNPQLSEWLRAIRRAAW